MIIMKLQGGLGNQMFQYASGFGISKRLNQDLYFDLSGFNTPEGVTKREYSLDVFSLTLPVRFSTESEKSPLLSNIKKIFGWNSLSYISEHGHSFNPEVFRIKKDAYLDGYWQSEKYFKEQEEKIRASFLLKNALSPESENIRKTMSTGTTIAVQVRRGDYVTNKKVSHVLGACPAKYYQDAVSTIASRQTPSTIFVFSDDIAWTQQNLQFPYPVVFVPETIKAHESIVLMSQCSHFVISNSSFGWWGAWLCSHSNKIVIAPKQWFRNSTLENRDITPESWLRM